MTRRGERPSRRNLLVGRVGIRWSAELRLVLLWRRPPPGSSAVSRGTSPSARGGRCSAGAAGELRTANGRLTAPSSIRVARLPAPFHVEHPIHVGEARPIHRTSLVSQALAKSAQQGVITETSAPWSLFILLEYRGSRHGTADESAADVASEPPESCAD